jgi:hypothetical protein
VLAATGFPRDGGRRCLPETAVHRGEEALQGKRVRQPADLVVVPWRGRRLDPDPDGRSQRHAEPCGYGPAVRGNDVGDLAVRDTAIADAEVVQQLLTPPRIGALNVYAALTIFACGRERLKIRRGCNGGDDLLGRRRFAVGNRLLMNASSDWNCPMPRCCLPGRCIRSPPTIRSIVPASPAPSPVTAFCSSAAQGRSGLARIAQDDQLASGARREADMPAWSYIALRYWHSKPAVLPRPVQLRMIAICLVIV